MLDYIPPLDGEPIMSPQEMIEYWIQLAEESSEE
ncbi:hypothetical protein J2S23_000849 [Streptococcus moroccensis]|uniref:Uncharacterized protein n=1 Tax=Streptococcus moroccensis TaxID=1451356 RepID=A0ABT9YQM4_9STRE|nr:hypothetical protein [Streptococcus moroccensis]